MSSSIKSSVQEVLEHKLIITDQAFRREDIPDWYGTHVYPMDDFSQLNEEILLKATAEYQRFLDWMINENVRTTPTLVREIERFYAKLEEKKKFLLGEETKLRNGVRVKGHLKKSDRHKRVSKDRVKSKRTLKINLIDTDLVKKYLENVCFLNYRLGQEAEKSLMGVDEGVVANLQEIVRVIAEQTRAKIDFSGRYNSIPSRNEDLHTDEEIVATAIYFCL